MGCGERRAARPLSPVRVTGVRAACEDRRMRSTVPARPAALAFALIFLAGCAELGQLAASAFQKPNLTFRSASLQALDLEGATVGFTFDVENPNAFGLSLARLGYGVEVEGTRIASGDAPGGMKIAPSGRTPVTFPVRVRFQDVPGIVALLGKRQDAVAYKLTGNLGFRTPVGVVDVPMGHSGTLALPKLPAFSLEALKVTGASFTEVGLEVRLRMKNPNAFPVPAGQLDYALSVAGHGVAEARGRSLSVVPGGGEATVAIPVRVSLTQLGRAATAVSQGGQVDLGLSGTAQVAGLAIPLNLAGRVPVRR